MGGCHSTPHRFQFEFFAKKSIILFRFPAGTSSGTPLSSGPEPTESAGKSFGGWQSQEQMSYSEILTRRGEKSLKPCSRTRAGASDLSRPISGLPKRGIPSWKNARREGGLHRWESPTPELGFIRRSFYDRRNVPPRWRFVGSISIHQKMRFITRRPRERSQGMGAHSE